MKPIPLTDLRKTQIKQHNELAEIGALQLRQNECAEDLRNGQSSISAQMTGITQDMQTLIADDSQIRSMMDVMISNQELGSEKLDTILSVLTQLRLAERHGPSIGECQASNIDTATRITRAKLLGFARPQMEQAFKTYHADTDRKLEGVRQSIDRLSGEVGNVLTAMQDKQLDSLDGNGRMQSSNSQVPCRPMPADRPLVPYEENTLPILDQGKRRSRNMSYHWKLRLPFGVIWVVVAVHTKKKSKSVAQAYKVETQPFSRRIRVTITFIPSTRLLWMKGFAMLYRIRQDQTSIYPEICPGITVFNTISSNAEIWGYTDKNDVDGLKELFAKRLASPHHRSAAGSTPLHVS